MKRAFQPNVKFSSLEDAGRIAKDYEASVFSVNNAVGGTSINKQRLASTKKRFGSNSGFYTAVISAIDEVEQLMNEKISSEHPEVYENLIAAYSSLCGACQAYINRSEKKYTDVGKKRLTIVKDIYTDAEKEILMLQMKYFDREGKFEGEGATFRQLLSGEGMAQRIQNDPTLFSLDEMKAAPDEIGQKYALGITVGELKSRLKGDKSVAPGDQSIIVILLEYYERQLSKLSQDPDGEDILPDILTRIKALSAGKDSGVLAELNQRIDGVMQTNGMQRQVSKAANLGGFVPSDKDLAGESLERMEREISDDIFSDYKVMTTGEVKNMAEQNAYNKGEHYERLYADGSERGQFSGYIATPNSNLINQYQREQEFDSVNYNSHATIGEMDEATKQNRLPRKTRFYRLVSANYLDTALGLSQANGLGYKAGTVQAINDIAGKVVTDAGFMCVGYQLDTFFGSNPVMLTLLCDQGMPVMATTNYNEAEFVFPRNTSYMILGARKKDKGSRNVIGSVGEELKLEGEFTGIEIICKVLNPSK